MNTFVETLSDSPNVFNLAKKKILFLLYPLCVILQTYIEINI